MNRSRKLKLGVVGGALSSAVGRSHLIASCMDHEALIVAGMFSRDNDKNKETGNFLKIENNRIYNSVEEFVINEKDKLDLILILTPTDNHFSTLKTLINNNFNIICEKSLTLNSRNVKS